MAWGWGGAGACPPNNVFFPSFILFLILILLVFGIGFWGLGGAAFSK